LTKEEFLEISETYSKIFDQSFQNKIDLYENEKKPVDFDWDDYPYFDEVRSLKDKQNKQMWNNFDKHIFAIFWMLELQDLTLPTETY
jgi:hypothetical protein